MPLPPSSLAHLVLLEHALAVNEALLEGHPAGLEPLQPRLCLLGDLHLVLAEDVELVVQRLKLGLNVRPVSQQLLQEVQTVAEVVQGRRRSGETERGR